MTTSAAAVSTPAVAEHPPRAILLVAALGVVFGDIGTSPIYAFRESLRAAGGVETQATVLGILSLVFWAVALVVALKYVVLVMRADNQGEGGTIGADFACFASSWAVALCASGHRAWWRVAVLWRRDDYAGDLGPERH
jgi:K+ transporter